MPVAPPRGPRPRYHDELPAGHPLRSAVVPIRYLMLNRDPLYTRSFRTMLKDAGVKVVRLPARSPNLVAHAERLVRSARSECLAWIIPLGDLHLRHVLSQYIEHPHRERNHRGLDNLLIEQVPVNRNAGGGPGDGGNGSVVCCPTTIEMQHDLRAIGLLHPTPPWFRPRAGPATGEPPRCAWSPLCGTIRRM